MDELTNNAVHITSTHSGPELHGKCLKCEFNRVKSAKETIGVNSFKRLLKMEPWQATDRIVLLTGYEIHDDLKLVGGLNIRSDDV